jgi:hypothetical protein
MSKAKKNKNKKWQQFFGVAFGGVLGGISGVLMVEYLDKMGDNMPYHQQMLSLGWILLAMYFAIFVHIIIHEAGHLVFGLLSGYKFSSFRIMSFMWLKEDGKLKLKRLSLAGTGGQCLMTPPDIKDGKIPLVLYNLGGSIINVIAGILFLGLYMIWPDVAFLSALLFAFSIMGFMTALLNGVPMRMGTIDNDGYNAFALSKNPEAVEAFWVQLKVAEQSSKGVRIKDMPAEWFAMPSEDAMKNSMVAARGVLACNRLMDEGKFEQADALMAHLLEMDCGIVGLHHDLLMCDRIFVELIGQNRREAIEDMLTKAQKKFMKAMKRYPSVLRTEYALALLFEKDTLKAEKSQKEFDKVAKTYPYPQEVESERELMQIAKDRVANFENA